MNGWHKKNKNEKNSNLKTFIPYERRFSHKIILNIVSMGLLRDDQKRNLNLKN